MARAQLCRHIFLGRKRAAQRVWLSLGFLVSAATAQQNAVSTSSLNSAAQQDAVSTVLGMQTFIKGDDTDTYGFGEAVALGANTLAVGQRRDSNCQAVANSGFNNCPGAGAVYIYTLSGAMWSLEQYLKAPSTLDVANGGASLTPFFGTDVALSSDGGTLAVGAYGDASCGEGSPVSTIHSTLTHCNQAGAVFIYTRASGTWTFRAYIKSDNPQINDQFGTVVVLSGSTLAVGSNKTETVWTYTGSGASWSFQARLTAPNGEQGDHFGEHVAVDSNTLVVSARLEDSSGGAISTSAPMGDNAATDSGAVYVFVWGGSSWNLQAFIKASNSYVYDEFGVSLALSGDTIAVGAKEGSCPDGSVQTVPGTNPGMGCDASGAVYIYQRSGTTWALQAFLKAPNAEQEDLFGIAVALRGGMLAIAADSEDSCSNFVESLEATVGIDNGCPNAGAVYVFKSDEEATAGWTFEAFVKAANTKANLNFGRPNINENLGLTGRPLALGANDDMLIVGARMEDSCSAGIRYAETPSATQAGCTASGAVYVFAPPCAAGTYTNLNTGDCHPCPSGTSQQIGGFSSACTECALGQEQPEAGARECRSCPAGKFSNVTGSAMCRSCPAGRFQPTTGQSLELSCLFCNVGTYSKNPSSEQCTDCPPDYFAGIGATKCAACYTGFDCTSGQLIACAPGFHSFGTGPCKICPPGAYCPGATSYTMCGKGTRAAPELNFTQCANCEAGKYQPATGSTACLECTPGYLCIEGSSAPQPCPGGTHADQSVLATVGYLSNLTSDCVTCPAGTSCSVGSAGPALCLPGSFTAVAASSRCTLCMSGTYQNLYGQTACLPCPTGSYCKEGTATPIPCPGGTSSNLTGRTSVGQCQPVPINYWAPIGSSLPELCFSGFYCPGAAADTVMTPPGSKPIIQEVGGSTALVEVPAVTKTMTLGISLDEFATQREAMKQALASQYGVDASQITLEALVSRLRRERRERRRLTGGLELTITITVPDAASGGSGSSSGGGGAQSAADLLTVVSNVDDSALGASLGAALGLPALSVTSSAPQTATSTVTVTVSCQPGYWCTAGLVVKCPINTYNNESEQDYATACKVCPLNSYTQELEARVSIDDCICIPEYYDTIVGPGVKCALCPVGTDCIAGGATLDRLRIKPGYFRLTNNTLDVVSCPDAHRGCLDEPVCESTTSGCAGGLVSEGNALCRGNLSDVYCRSCRKASEEAAGTVPLYYSPATNTRDASCEVCPDNLIGTIILVVVGVVVGLVALTWSLRCYRRLAVGRKDAMLVVWTAFRPVNKFKILAGFYMIASRVDVVYQVVLPYQVKRVLVVIGDVFSLGLAGIGTPLECLGLRGFHYKLLSYVVAPALAALCIAASTAIWLRCTRGRVSLMALMEAGLPWVLRIFFLAYPSIVNVAFDAFPCYTLCVDDGDPCETQQYLMADPSIECDTSEHSDVTALAWFAIFLYPVGLFVLNAALLFAARKAILSGKHTTLSRTIRFLYAEYEPHFYWWELVEMARRLILVGFLVLLSGALLQIILGTMFTAIFLLVQVQAAPYVLPVDDQLAALSSFSLTILFLCQYAYKQAALVDDADIAGKMSREQQRIYLVDQGVLSLILIGAIGGTFLFSIFIFVLTYRKERRRMKAEKRAAKARRLRYLNDGSEAMLRELPPLEGEIARIHPNAATNTSYGAVLPRHGPFHCFLSHNWKHGQSEMRIMKTRLLEMLPDVSIFLDVDFLGGGADFPHIDVSDCMLCYLTEKWFTNAPCICEIVRAMVVQCPLIAVLEPDETEQHGGHPEAKCREILMSDKFAADMERFMGPRVAKWREDWGRADLRLPTGQEIVDALFANPAIIWYRLTDFQDVSMRLIAERLLPQQAAIRKASPSLAPAATSVGQPPSATEKKAKAVAAGRVLELVEQGDAAAEDAGGYVQLTYMEGEIAQHLKRAPPKLPAVRADCQFHLYCSPHGPRRFAQEMAQELQAKFLPSLTWTDDPSRLAECEHMVVPLTAETWVRGGAATEQETADAFAHEVCEAMRVGVHRLLCHEVPGGRMSDERNACSFDQLIGDTPRYLMAAGIYDEIAMNLQSDEWRDAGLAKTATQLVKGSGTREQWKPNPMVVEPTREELRDRIETSAAAVPPPTEEDTPTSDASGQSHVRRKLKTAGLFAMLRGDNAKVTPLSVPTVPVQE